MVVVRCCHQQGECRLNGRSANRCVNQTAGSKRIHFMAPVAEGRWPIGGALAITRHPSISMQWPLSSRGGRSGATPNHRAATSSSPGEPLGRSRSVPRVPLSPAVSRGRKCRGDFRGEALHPTSPQEPPEHRGDGRARSRGPGADARQRLDPVENRWVAPAACRGANACSHQFGRPSWLPAIASDACRAGWRTPPWPRAAPHTLPRLAGRAHPRAALW